MDTNKNMKKGDKEEQQRVSASKRLDKIQNTEMAEYRSFSNIPHLDREKISHVSEVEDVKIRILEFVQQNQIQRFYIEYLFKYSDYLSLESQISFLSREEHLIKINKSKFHKISNIIKTRKACIRKIKDSLENEKFNLSYSKVLETYCQILSQLRTLTLNLIEKVEAWRNWLVMLQFKENKNVVMGSLKIPIIFYSEGQNIFETIKFDTLFLQTSILRRYIFFSKSSDPLLLHPFRLIISSISNRMKNFQPVWKLFDLSQNMQKRLESAEQILKQENQYNLLKKAEEKILKRQVQNKGHRKSTDCVCCRQQSLPLDILKLNDKQFPSLLKSRQKADMQNLLKMKDEMRSFEKNIKASTQSQLVERQSKQFLNQVKRKRKELLNNDKINTQDIVSDNPRKKMQTESTKKFQDILNRQKVYLLVQEIEERRSRFFKKFINQESQKNSYTRYEDSPELLGKTKVVNEQKHSRRRSNMRIIKTSQDAKFTKQSRKKSESDQQYYQSQMNSPFKFENKQKDKLYRKILMSKIKYEKEFFGESIAVLMKEKSNRQLEQKSPVQRFRTEKKMKSNSLKSEGIQYNINYTQTTKIDEEYSQKKYYYQKKQIINQKNLKKQDPIRLIADNQLSQNNKKGKVIQKYQKIKQNEQENQISSQLKNEKSNLENNKSIKIKTEQPEKLLVTQQKGKILDVIKSRRSRNRRTVTPANQIQMYSQQIRQKQVKIHNKQSPIFQSPNREDESFSTKTNINHYTINSVQFPMTKYEAFVTAYGDIFVREQKTYIQEKILRYPFRHFYFSEVKQNNIVNAIVISRIHIRQRVRSLEIYLFKFIENTGKNFKRICKSYLDYIWSFDPCHQIIYLHYNQNKIMNPLVDQFLRELSFQECNNGIPNQNSLYLERNKKCRNEQGQKYVAKIQLTNLLMSRTEKRIFYSLEIESFSNENYFSQFLFYHLLKFTLQMQNIELQEENQTISKFMKIRHGFKSQINQKCYRFDNVEDLNDHLQERELECYETRQNISNLNLAELVIGECFGFDFIVNNNTMIFQTDNVISFFGEDEFDQYVLIKMINYKSIYLMFAREKHSNISDKKIKINVKSLLKKLTDSKFLNKVNHSKKIVQISFFRKEIYGRIFNIDNIFSLFGYFIMIFHWLDYLKGCKKFDLEGDVKEFLNEFTVCLVNQESTGELRPIFASRIYEKDLMSGR